MSISRIPGPGEGPFSFAYLKAQPRGAAAPSRDPSSARGDDELRELGRELSAMRNSLARLLDASRLRSRRSSSAGGTLGASATSTKPLQLAKAKHAVLASGDELNTSTTSFGPGAPKFEGSSTSAVTLGGTYDGSLGDQTLTFRVRVGGDVGVKNAQVEVLDASGQKIDQFRVDKEQAPGSPFAISFGLTASFGEGTLEAGDSFQLQVSASSGTNVDLAAAFDGSDGSGPGFDAGLAVGAGAFRINGTTIQVEADESLQDVLGRITSSDAGVTATYDAASDRVLLKQKTAGAESSIALGPDSSGFFAALKLNGATLSPGADDELSSALSGVGAFDGVRRGAFEVNGERVEVDPDQDSLEDVLARIEAAAPGVEAEYDAESGRVTLSAATGETLVLEGDTSGFLASLGIAGGSYGAPTQVQRGSRRVTSERGVRKGLHDLTRGFASLGASRSSATAQRFAGDVRSALDGAARKALEALDQPGAKGAAVRTGLGIDVGVPGEGPLSIDVRALERALDGSADELSAFLQGDVDEQGDGLLGQLDLALESIQRRLALHLDPGRDTGFLLDLQG